jgi:hypothetical protein
MNAMGPGERAQVAEALRGDAFAGLEARVSESMAAADPDELRARFGDEVGGGGALAAGGQGAQHLTTPIGWTARVRAGAQARRCAGA